MKPFTVKPFLLLAACRVQADGGPCITIGRGPCRMHDPER